jgi:phosphatidylglycerophosphatase C
VGKEAVAVTTSIAAFDMDNTVLDCESQVLFVHYLAAQRLAPASLRLEVAFWFALNRLGWVTDVPRVHDRLVSRYSGIPRQALIGALQDFTDAELMPRIRKDAQEWVSRVRAEGCHIVLLSASPEAMVARLAAAIGVDGYAATRLTLDRPGRLSVDGEMVYGEAKMRALQAYADRRFPSWRLAYAFGNDYADRFLLSAAAHPVAVCPSPRLRQLADEHGWARAVWR